MSKHKVAVIGASGIGKFHAEWWARLGADVCAFAGSSPESVAKTAEKLGALFGFSGRGYPDVAAMLATEKPAFVDVCSPPRLHLVHVRQALEAGCSVLCEKPFYYAKGESVDAQLRAAREVVDLACNLGRSLGICTQYAAMGAFCLKQFQQATGRARPAKVHGHIASPAKAEGLDPADIWADLAPHSLGAIQAIAPGATMRQDSLHTRFGKDIAEAEFDLDLAGERVSCRVIAEKRREPPSHIRRLALDDQGFDMDDVKDDTGVLRSRVRRGNDEWLIENVLRETIRRFMEGAPLLGPGEALVNHEWCVGALRAR